MDKLSDTYGTLQGTYDKEEITYREQNISSSLRVFENIPSACMIYLSSRNDFERKK